VNGTGRLREGEVVLVLPDFLRNRLCSQFSIFFSKFELREYSLTDIQRIRLRDKII